MSIIYKNKKKILNSKGIGINYNGFLNLNNDNIFNCSLYNIKTCIVDQPILSGYCVYDNNSKLNIVTALEQDKFCSGVNITNAFTTQFSAYMAKGIFTDQRFSFSEPFGRPIWVGINGLPTDIQPKTGFLQCIGTSISENTLYLNIKDKITTIQNYKNKLQLFGELYYCKDLLMYNDSDLILTTANVAEKNKCNSIKYLNNTPSTIWIFNNIDTSNIVNVSVFVNKNNIIEQYNQSNIQITEKSIIISFTDEYIGYISVIYFNE